MSHSWSFLDFGHIAHL